jgi:hypothetical protein
LFGVECGHIEVDDCPGFAGPTGVTDEKMLLVAMRIVVGDDVSIRVQVVVDQLTLKTRYWSNSCGQITGQFSNI